MVTNLNSADFAALSPLLIILTGALMILLLESLREDLSKRISWIISLLTLTTAFFSTLHLEGTTSDLLKPWLNLDNTYQFATVIFITIGISITFLADGFLKHFGATHGEFYFLLLSSIFGLILIGAANDFLILFLGLETLSIALYVLCGYMKSWKLSQESSLKYFLLGAIAAAFLLYGIAMIYGATGTTRFDLLLEKYNALTLAQDKTLFMAGACFITLGLFFKAAVVPFHIWAPDVYDGAPTPVTAFMAVGTKVGAFIALARIFLEALYQFNPIWNDAIAIFAYPTLIFANVVAIRQKQLKRFFAYSGISHAGFLLIPLAASNPGSMSSMLFYLVVYSLSTLGSFAVFAFMDRDRNGVLIDDLKGLFTRQPMLAVFLTFCLLTLAAIPPTSGFFAKLYIFKAAFESGYFGLVIVGLLTSVLSAFYYIRIVGIIFTPAHENNEKIAFVFPAAIVGIFCFIGLLILSIYPNILIPYMNALN